MRKSRVEETSKNPSTGVRSQVTTRVRNITKEEIVDKKKRSVDQKHGASDVKLKTVRSSHSSVMMQNGGGEQDRQQASSTVKSRTKLVESSNSSPTVASKSKTKVMTKSSGDSSKLRMEKKSNSEKRGISTIFMPKTEVARKMTKSMGPKEVSKIHMTSGRHKDSPSTKVASDRGKNSSVKSKNDPLTRQRLPSRERRRSRTLSPSEVKILHSRSQIADNGSKNLVQSFSHSTPVKNTKINDNNETDEDYVYEDDFEVSQFTWVSKGLCTLDFLFVFEYTMYKNIKLNYFLLYGLFNFGLSFVKNLVSFRVSYFFAELNRFGICFTYESFDGFPESTLTLARAFCFPRN